MDRPTKHLAQFTLSNAPHGPTLSSCLSVCLLIQPTGALQILKYTYLFFLLCPKFVLNLPLIIFISLFIQTSTHSQVDMRRRITIFTFYSSIFCSPSLPSPSLYNNLYDLFLLFHTPVALSPAVSLSLSIKSTFPPTEGCLNRWLVAGCCCALLVGLQEAAYLSAC